MREFVKHKTFDRLYYVRTDPKSYESNGLIVDTNGMTAGEIALIEEMCDAICIGRKHQPRKRRRKSL